MATKSGKSKKAGRNSDWCKSYKLREQDKVNKGLKLLNHLARQIVLGECTLDLSKMADGTITVRENKSCTAYLAWAAIPELVKRRCLRAWLDRRKTPARTVALADMARNLFAAVH